MKIVLDTNVLLVSFSRKSEYRWIFDSFLNEDFTLFVLKDIQFPKVNIISPSEFKLIIDRL